MTIMDSKNGNAGISKEAKSEEVHGRDGTGQDL